jgi:hypothetical protein
MNRTSVSSVSRVSIPARCPVEVYSPVIDLHLSDFRCRRYILSVGDASASPRIPRHTAAQRPDGPLTAPPDLVTATQTHFSGPIYEARQC